MTVYIDDGDEKPRALVFARTEERTVTFSPVPPGSRKLYVITTDRTQVPDSPNDKRQLGVRIIVDHQWLLRDLARTRGAGQKRRDLRHVIEHHVQDKVTMLGGFMAALGLGWNGFTEGKDAAAVVVSNPGKDKMTPRIRLSSLARPQDMPVTVKVEGGEWHESVQFNQPGEQHLSLPAVLPGGIRLFTFTVSKPWNHPRAASRLLGVKLDVTTPGLLEMLRGSRGPGLHGAAAATLVRERSQDLRKLGDGGAQLGGVTNDGWTSGGKPGAVVISNRSYKTAWWELTLGCDAGAASLPITALVDDGEKPITARFLKAGDQRVVLSPIAPYSRKLYLITTDQSWTPTGGTDRRLLGVRITSARQIVKGAAKE